MAEITKSNFDEMFPVVEKAIRNASFISVDTEFTGLWLDSTNNASLFDSLEERYQKLKKRASSFIVSQIGITTFIKCAKENRYNAETFVFFIRPYLCGSNDRLFMCQASSFDFLTRYDFDFNKFAKEGIPFINEAEENSMRAEMSENSFFFPHEMLMELAFKRNQDLLISDFLLKSEVGDKIYLEKDAVCHEFFQVNELRRKYTSLWAYNGDNKVVLEKVSPEKRKELEKGVAIELERLMEFFLGFTRVFRLLRDAKKPIVGHNFLMDLLFIFHCFHQPLPKNYKNFKKELHEVFPVIYDTRHIWLNVKKFCKFERIPKESALFDLYRMFQKPPENLRTLFAPSIVHVNGEKYKVDLPHESGFDSYVTGWVFIKICHLLSIKKISASNPALMEPQTLKQHFKAVEPFKNKVNMSMSRSRFINIGGNDPVPQTTDYLYVTVKKSNTLNRCQLTDVFGRYAMVEAKLSSNRKAAILVVGSLNVFRDILRDFKNHDDLAVEEYDILKHYWPAKAALWATLLGTGVMTSYLVVKLIQLHR